MNVKSQTLIWKERRKMEINFSTGCTSEDCLHEGRIWAEYIPHWALLQEWNSQPDWAMIPVPLPTHVWVPFCPVAHASPLTPSHITSATCCLYDKLRIALKFREFSCQIPGEGTSKGATGWGTVPHRPSSNEMLKFIKRCLCLDRILAPFPGSGINIQERGSSERLSQSKNKTWDGEGVNHSRSALAATVVWV